MHWLPFKSTRNLIRAIMIFAIFLLSRKSITFICDIDNWIIDSLLTPLDVGVSKCKLKWHLISSVILYSIEANDLSTYMDIHFTVTQNV